MATIGGVARTRASGSGRCAAANWPRATAGGSRPTRTIRRSHRGEATEPKQENTGSVLARGFRRRMSLDAEPVDRHRELTCAALDDPALLAILREGCRYLLTTVSASTNESLSCRGSSRIRSTVASSMQARRSIHACRAPPTRRTPARRHARPRRACVHEAWRLLSL
jgi:hypothetical protein